MKTPILVNVAETEELDQPGDFALDNLAVGDSIKVLVRANDKADAVGSAIGVAALGNAKKDCGPRVAFIPVWVKIKSRTQKKFTGIVDTLDIFDETGVDQGDEIQFHRDNIREVA